MGPEHRHTDAGAGDLELGAVEDAAALVLHLHFFGSVAIFQTVADAGDDVEGDLGGEDLGLDGLAFGQGLHLVLQLLQPGLTGTGDGLVGAGHHALDGRELVEGGHRHEGDDGGAVGVGHDAVVLQRVGPVDLGHHQGDAVLQTKGRAIVNVDGPGFFNSRAEFPGHPGADGPQDEIHPVKAVLPGFLHHDLLPTEGDGAPGAAGRSQGAERPHGDLVFLQDLEHFPAHGSRCTENGDVILFHIGKTPFINRRIRRKEHGWRCQSHGCPRPR